MEYNFNAIEKKWQQYWRENNTYKTTIQKDKPKYYVLDMFPYPSGSGLHVGHPLGYIASDIYSRYKKLSGYNVLHPMGYDAYGLPAEQYAIQTGQHPAITTEINLKKYREQLDKIGFSFDWSREVRTCSPDYYKWTQWAFIQMFSHYYDTKEQAARPIKDLQQHFSLHGTQGLQASGSEELSFSAKAWNEMSEQEQQNILLNYRIAYLANTKVNWCPALGTVLANDEVSDGLSVRGGHPVEQKVMKQWCLRVSAYAQQLLNGLDNLDWSESVKEIQRNWIGRSEGAEMKFSVKGQDLTIQIFTTRADTIFGATFMVLAPESELVKTLTTTEQKQAVEKYLEETKLRSERERMAETKSVTGVFSGSYAINPLTGQEIPIWIADYVLAGYGTGAIMAVPAHDSRDFAFARTFNLPITQVVVPTQEQEAEHPSLWTNSIDSKEGTMINSGFLNGLSVVEAIAKTKEYITENQLGKVKVNYRLRDATFSRQRYWGEPFPIYYKDGIPYTLEADELPLELPEIDQYQPTSDGKPPLGHAKNWVNKDGYPLELNTMPGFAGSSAYFLRYMDPHNDKQLVSQEANEYWQNVDLYIGGREHATGHLIYARFWNMFLYDIGEICQKEPFKKMVNQGMIQGRSNFVYRIKDTNTFVSLGLKDKYQTTAIHVDVNMVHNDRLNLDAFRAWNAEYAQAEFILENDEYICGWTVEKMSKSLYNVVNPDLIIEQYGADTLRLYEMFLGPLEQAKPWDTKGIDGVHRFLKKLWNLFYDRDKLIVSDDKATPEELKVLHKTIKKITADIEHFSFNTSVSAFMICVNELTTLKCSKKDVLEPLAIILSPFAPHLTEELWSVLGKENSICLAQWPRHDESYLVEQNCTYPVSFNGKVRFKIELPKDMPKDEVEKQVLAHENAQRWLEGVNIKKIIVVPGKIVNIVVG